MSEVGVVGLGPAYAVTDGGAIGLVGQVPVVEWWIGAEDRWHQASTDITRQTSGDDGTSVETRLRIPSGDAIQRVTAVPDNGRVAALVEIENDSPVPVAVAVRLSVPSANVVVSADSVAIDGHVVLRAQRPIARALVAKTAPDLLAAVDQGEALPPGEVDWPQSGNFVAVILPLPHTAVSRFSVALGEHAASLSSPGELPEVAAIGRGWSTHIAAGAEVVLPDERLSRVVVSARRHLLVGSGLHADDAFWVAGVGAGGPAIAAMALQAWGHHVAAKELLLAASGPDDLTVHATRTPIEGASLLLAWAELFERRGDPELETALAPWFEQVALGVMHRGGRRDRRNETNNQRAWRAVGLAAAGSFLTRTGEATVGSDMVDALPELIAEVSVDTPSLALALGGNRLGLTNQSVLEALAAVLDCPLRSLTDLAAQADHLGALPLGRRSQNPMLSALALLAVRRALVDEPRGSGGPVALLPGPDPSWWGARVEAHHMPIGGGEVDFGVRWHGERPALLWDIQTPVVSPEVTSPGFDPSWSDQSASGETLLAVDAGWSSASGPVSPDVRRGRAIDPDNEPGSLS